MAAGKGALTVGLVVVVAACIVAAAKVMEYVKADIREDYREFYPMQSGTRLEEQRFQDRKDLDKLATEMKEFGELQRQTTIELGGMKKDDLRLAEILERVETRLHEALKRKE